MMMMMMTGARPLLQQSNDPKPVVRRPLLLSRVPHLPLPSSYIKASLFDIILSYQSVLDQNGNIIALTL